MQLAVHLHHLHSFRSSEPRGNGEQLQARIVMLSGWTSGLPATRRSRLSVLSLASHHVLRDSSPFASFFQALPMPV